MKNTTKGISYVMATCALICTMFSCKNSTETASSTKCADSTTTTTTTTTVTDTAAANTEGPTGSMNMNEDLTTTKKENTHTTVHTKKMADGWDEPTGPGKLSISSAAFTNYGVIPVKYTCDGQGATPPIDVANIPPGTKSLALIVHDYHATPEQGLTYWIIWNLDTTGKIPEDFRNDHESTNTAKQYGYNPICAKSGDHKYHFIVYALDTKLVIGKNTTKHSLENVMRDHILGKGELIGLYNKRLE